MEPGTSLYKEDTSIEKVLYLENVMKLRLLYT